MFIDANLFTFHALSDSEYGEASTQLLERTLRSILHLKRLEMLEIVGITPRTAFSLVELGERYGLLPSDLFHIATMKEFGIEFIATDDFGFQKSGVGCSVLVELEV